MTDTKDRGDFSIWLKSNHPDLDEVTVDRLHRFGQLVAESADRLGLVGRGDLPRLYTRHFRESLAPAFLRHLPLGSRILDVGSGAGFPAIPVAVVRSDLHLTLSESREKKAAFLQRAVLTLNLTGVSVFPGSLEELGRRKTDRAWDCVVARAIRWTPRMVKAVEGMLREKGTVIRFGAVSGTPAGVVVDPLGGEDRAVQVWGRSSWPLLPDAP